MLTKIGNCYIDLDEIVSMCQGRDGNGTIIRLCGGGGSITVNAPIDELISALDAAGLLAQNEAPRESELTAKQCAALTKLYDEGYRWIATDKTGVARAYEFKPDPDGAYWILPVCCDVPPKRVNCDLPFTFDDGAISLANLLGAC